MGSDAPNRAENTWRPQLPNRSDASATLAGSAHDGHGAGYLLPIVVQQHDGEFDGDAPAVSGQPRH